jgi:hypothetical protein
MLHDLRKASRLEADNNLAMKLAESLTKLRKKSTDPKCTLKDLVEAG